LNASCGHCFADGHFLWTKNHVGCRILSVEHRNLCLRIPNDAERPSAAAGHRMRKIETERSIRRLSRPTVRMPADVELHEGNDVREYTVGAIHVRSTPITAELHRHTVDGVVKLYRDRRRRV